MGATISLTIKTFDFDNSNLFDMSWDEIDMSTNQIRLILVNRSKVNGTNVLNGSDNRMRRMKGEGKSSGKISGSNMKASFGKRVTIRH